jgi:hypothetical protein
MGETRGAAYFHKPCRTELELYKVVKDMRNRKVYGVDKPSAAIIWVVVKCQRGIGRKSKGKEKDLYVGVALHNLLYPGQRQGWVAIVGSLLLCSIDLSLPEGVEELV